MSSLTNAMRILSLLSKERPVLRVGEVCRDLDLPKSSVSRLLKELSEFGIVEREAGEFGYGAGRMALTLAETYMSRHTLLDQVEIAIAALANEFGFVGYIAVQSGPDIVIVQVKHGAYPLRLVQAVGERIPAFRTAIGRALLARTDDAEAVELVRSGADAPVFQKDILTELGIVRRTGISLISDWVIPGIAAIGAAVSDPAKGEQLGFSISYPVSATDDLLRERMAQRVREVAQAIGIREGDQFWTSFGSTELVEPINDASAGKAGGHVAKT
jgi:DNA-binding IclR family transcriptional regulator